MSTRLQAIQKTLKANASKATAESQKKFVPGVSKMYGVSMPVLNTLAKENKEGGFPLVEGLATSDYIEEKILAAQLLGLVAKNDPTKAFVLFKQLAASIDNWAVCDALGMQALKPLVKTHAAEIFRLSAKYNKSANPWLRRLSLVMVEWYTRDNSFHPQIHALIGNLAGDQEYYVKKAIQWIERNFTKDR